MKWIAITIVSLALIGAGVFIYLEQKETADWNKCADLVRAEVERSPEDPNLGYTPPDLSEEIIDMCGHQP